MTDPHFSSRWKEVNHLRAESMDLLVVEDSQDDLAFILHALNGMAVAPEIRTVRDGAEALSMILGDAESGSEHLRVWPKVILLDLKLPKVDGLEVLRRLRAHPEGHLIPVVVFSSSLEKRDLKACYEYGVNSYLVKPMDAGKFSASVRTLANYWLQLNQSPKR